VKSRGRGRRDKELESGGEEDAGRVLNREGRKNGRSR